MDMIMDNLTPDTNDKPLQRPGDPVAEDMEQISQFINKLKIKRSAFGGFNRLYVWELLKELNTRYQNVIDKQQLVMDSKLSAIRRELDNMTEQNKFLNERIRVLSSSAVMPAPQGSGLTPRAKPGETHLHYYIQSVSTSEPPKAAPAAERPAESAPPPPPPASARPVQPQARPVFKPVAPIPPRDTK